MSIRGIYGAMDLPTKTLLEAIARRLYVMATYNSLTMKLAPHILYTRHDVLYLDAVAVERGGQPPRELKLGVFNLSGLNDVRLTEESFQPQDRDLFEPEAEKYAGVTLFAIEA